jgi:hypothetical protein
MDIVEQLRTEAPSYVLIGDAAVEIERLREDRERLRDALLLTLPFVKKDEEVEAIVHAALMEE